jgi:hypothetical protein
MRRTAVLATLDGMPSPTYRQLILEAAIDGSVIRGTLTAPTGEQRGFHGWLELSTALEVILTSGRGDHSPAGGAQPNRQEVHRMVSPTRVDQP